MSILAAGLSFAAASDKKKVASVVAGCCAKSIAAGNVCAHPCCVAAAKDGMNCTKCKGSGPIVKAKKGKKKKAE